MSDIFISYSRHSESIARTLVHDIEELGHTVWFDQELSGGQAWWYQILTRIRDCQVFVFLLDQKALKSSACISEYGYAINLGKPILPILVADDISTNLLPPALSKIQFVDYRKQDRDAAFRLARALTTVPPPKPLPDPLPPPPEVPASYLGGLAEKIETTATLSVDEQNLLVASLKRSLRDIDTTNDGHALLEMLRKRRDLFASVAEDIDELLKSTPKALASPPLRAPEPVTFSFARVSVATEPNIEKRVSIWLGLGIFAMPWIFSWFLLREGYSKTARYIGFGWLAILVIIGISNQNNNTY